MSNKPHGYSNLVECPYNRAHQIENGRRFQTHLVKCRKEYEKLHTTEKVQCPFNATHYVNGPEHQHHIENCPDRILVDKFQNPIVDSMEALQKKDQIKMTPQVQSADDEDWDDEPPAPAYDPQKYCESNNILRRCNGMQPHERKAFRQQEHQRLSNMRQFK
ncbi:gametocyte-specific factor 1 homolog [Lutzomyia longipalpis]|uniref:gametocyte-specific factor 1 homolog n=1 Tax=Lutzomyia longipalpis TaxID=7200 RepID=UPI0024844727|nr:gametocyte-specific factor 1 homolog [Lutzomyia longipalpis]